MDILMDTPMDRQLLHRQCSLDQPPGIFNFWRNSTMEQSERNKASILLSGALAVLVIGILVGLGLWQLQRAKEKQAIVKLAEIRQQQEPIQLAADIDSSLKDLRYNRVEVTGIYDSSHQFLLDNQVKNGKIGVFVLTPLKIDGSRHSVLVNRGWVPMTRQRTVNADLAVPQTPLRIHGTLRHFSEPGYRFKGVEVPAAGWPSLLQMVEPEQLSKRLGYPLAPVQILLAPDSPSGFVCDWKISNGIHPRKHTAYAVQWFALAATLLFILIRQLSKPRATKK